jgi:zinc protease
VIRRFRHLFLAAAVLLPAALPAQQIPSLRHEKYTLDNGLEVILHQDRSVPLVAVEMLYKVGSADEQKGRTGFAHLFEHVMFMGSQNVPVGAFDQWLEAAGANNNGSTNNDRTNYYEWMPSNALPLALWLEADRMGRLLPTMDQQKLDVQRDVVKNERRQRVDNVPYGRAGETMIAAMYPSTHPYSWPVIGSLADLTAASLEDVKEFFRTYYAPNNATLVIAGDFESAEAKALVSKYFAGIPRGPQLPPRPNPPQVTVARDTFMVLEDRVQLPRVFWTWPTVKLFSPNDAALDMLASILAGDKNARLYKRLVYDMQIAQSVGANHFSGKLDGHFRVDVTPRPGQEPQRIAQLVKEEIEKIANEGVTQRELDRVRNSHLAGFLDNLASVQSKASQLAQYNFVTGDPDYAQEDAARYTALTTADIQRVAREYLGKPKLVLTVVPQGKKELAVTGNVP